MGGRRGGSKGSFQALVVRDLGLQGLRGLLHGGAVPFAAQPRKGLHLPDGHLGLAQAQQESDPFHVRRRITALAAGCAGYWRNQPGALVVAQGVCQEPVYDLAGDPCEIVNRLYGLCVWRLRQW